MIVYDVDACSKNAPLEGLEIDQYMWGIADQLSKSEADEINIEANASWKPNRPVIKKDEDSKGELIDPKGQFCSNALEL